MQTQTIPVKNLEPGDILMCIYEHPGAEEYLEALITTLRYYNYTNDEEYRKFIVAAFVIIRGMIIYFDEDKYTHAAFWDGEHVVEAGLDGVEKNPIDHYKGVPTDIYRFSKDGNLKLGSPDYPVQPLLDVSEAIVAQELNYSFNTAILYMFLSVTRWERAAWIEAMKEYLKAHVTSISPSLIDFFFVMNHDKLLAFFEWMADEVIRQIVKFRKDDGLVCSETVAAIFNNAEPKGKYHLEKPLTAAAPNSIQNNTSISSNPDAEQKLQAFADALGESKAAPLKTEFNNDWDIDVDILYTPHDIAASTNTTLVGELEF